MATRVRVWLAAAASRQPVPSAHLAERLHLLPVPQQGVGAGQSVGDQGRHRLAVRVGPSLRQRLAEPSAPPRRADPRRTPSSPARSCAKGTAPTPAPPGAGPGRGPPRPASGGGPRSAAGVRGRLGTGEMSEAHCRWVAASARRPRPPPRRPDARAERPGPRPGDPGTPPGGPTRRPRRLWRRPERATLAASPRS